MNIFKNLYNHFTKDVTGRKKVAVILGNLILGVGTIVGAFCFGPLINFFNKYNCKWIIK